MDCGENMITASDHSDGHCWSDFKFGCSEEFLASAAKRLT
jgi:hypothetical protein